MDWPALIGAAALLWVVSIIVAEFTNMKPYWVRYVPGLPVLIAAGYLLCFLFMVIVALGAGFYIGVRIFVLGIIHLPELYKALRPQPDDAGASVVPELKIV